MKFSRLKGRARERALDHYRYVEVEYNGWWDTTYEDAVRMGALLGIEIGTRQMRSVKGNSIDVTDICFQLSYCQGDGCSFAGVYRSKPDAVAAVQAETNDPELLRIAQELTIAQTTATVTLGMTFRVNIMHTTHNCGIRVEIVSDAPLAHDVDTDTIDDMLTKALDDFNDWLFAQLRAQHEYLTSDECVADWIRSNGIEFTREGDVKTRALATA